LERPPCRNPPDNPQHDALYHIPIETLRLSDKAIKAVKRTGIETVGDCVDFFARIANGGSPGLVRFNFTEAMFNEVKPKLEAHGYWPPGAIDDAD
jgi:hypothetical protein